MSLHRFVIAPIRSQIAALIARVAPEYYKQLIERRHPGVRVIADSKSDVRVLKEQSLDYVMQALDALNIPLLAKIDDRACWILLVGSENEPDTAEQLAVTLLDLGLRVAVSREDGRSKYIASEKQLTRLNRDNPQKITSIKAGFLWMRARGLNRIGWHTATRIHMYERDGAADTFCARKAGNLPPAIDKDRSGDVTIAGLSNAATRLDKIRFPVDVVYTWVDGNDSTWNDKRQQRAAETGRRVHKVANSQTRYINRDELRYSLRSLYYYAPWVRNIYLVTDNQYPDWLDKSSNSLKVVSHQDLFPDPGVLPTFNSHAIESVLHRIPGLSEQFIYMNDDVFLSSVVHPESFFEVGGIARVFLSRSMIPYCDENRSDIASEWGVMNANQLLKEAVGAIMPYKTKHTPIALRKSLMQSLEERFSPQFERLRQSPFRTKNDLAPTSSLHACFGMAEGLVVRSNIAYRYVNLARSDLMPVLASIENSRRSMVFCLNDTEIDDHAEFDWTSQEQMVTGFLKRMYPYRAPWEKCDPSDGLE